MQQMTSSTIHVVETAKTSAISLAAIAAGALADFSTVAGQLAVIIGMLLAAFRLYVGIDKWTRWRREKKKDADE